MLSLNIRSLPSCWSLTFSLLYFLNSPSRTVLSIHILSRGADKRTEQCAPGTFKIGKTMSFLVCAWLFLKFSSCTRYLTLNLSSAPFLFANFDSKKNQYMESIKYRERFQGAFPYQISIITSHFPKYHTSVFVVWNHWSVPTSRWKLLPVHLQAPTNDQKAPHS